MRSPNKFYMTNLLYIDIFPDLIRRTRATDGQAHYVNIIKEMTNIFLWLFFKIFSSVF